MFKGKKSKVYLTINRNDEESICESVTDCEALRKMSNEYSDAYRKLRDQVDDYIKTGVGIIGLVDFLIMVGIVCDNKDYDNKVVELAEEYRRMESKNLSLESKITEMWDILNRT